MKKEEEFNEKADELIQFCKSRVTILEKQIGLNSEKEDENENIKDKFIKEFLEEDFNLSSNKK